MFAEADGFPDEEYSRLPIRLEINIQRNLLVHVIAGIRPVTNASWQLKMVCNFVIILSLYRLFAT
jgi:hypothetical protein